MTHMMIKVNPMAISVETPKVNNRCYFEKEFIKLIHMNPWMVLYLAINKVDSCHSCAGGPLI